MNQFALRGRFHSSFLGCGYVPEGSPIQSARFERAFLRGNENANVGVLARLDPHYVEEPIDPKREYAIERIAKCRGITIGEARKARLR